MRIAAADMYPDQRKAEGVSYILMANTVGAMGGPILIASASNYAEAVGMDPYSMPWLFTPVLAIISAGLIVLIRPDPREIAHNLGHYYPGLPSKSPSVGLEVTGRRILRLFSYYPIFVTLLVVSLAWANMSMMMSLVSVVLHNNGFPLASISTSVAIHLIGMFAPSVPLGGLADRLGRKRMRISGSVLSGIGALLTPVSESYILITLGIFLVGLGWSAAIVTSTALIADVTSPLVRGRILGIIETVSGIFSLAFPIVGGLIASLSGFMVLGVVGLLATIPCLAAAIFLKEKAPAVYEHRYPHLGTPE